MLKYKLKESEFMTISDLHHKSFVNRLNVSDFYTAALMEFLKESNHFSNFRKSEKQEDLDGIDWWVEYPDKKGEFPIQFKLRDKQKDIPICRYQPFHGIDSEKTVEGRDFKLIKNKKAVQYYIAIRNGNSFKEIYRISCKSLNKMILEMDQHWQEVSGVFDSFPPSFFSKEKNQLWIEKGLRNKRVFSDENGCEVWWKKNHNEKFSKFNMYVPYSLNEWSIFLNSKDAEKINSLYQEYEEKR